MPRMTEKLQKAIEQKIVTLDNHGRQNEEIYNSLKTKGYYWILTKKEWGHLDSRYNSETDVWEPIIMD